MEDLRHPHIAARGGRGPLQRPAASRPTGRPGRHRPKARPINEVLLDLSGTRQRYEHLRTTDASLSERARLVSVLHELRAEAFQARRAVRET